MLIIVVSQWYVIHYRVNVAAIFGDVIKMVPMNSLSIASQVYIAIWIWQLFVVGVDPCVLQVLATPGAVFAMATPVDYQW
jgi:hypothetical protein